MTTENELTLYIADDHPIVVDGLKEILKANKDCLVKGTAHNGLELIELIKQATVDIVIVDIHMPQMDGIQCTKWIKEKHPEIKVLVLTMYPEKVYIDQLMKSGADGCLLKSRGSEDLLEAIERVRGGKFYFDWASDFKTRSESIQHKLSSREIEIIKLLTHGKHNLEIADALFISEETVKTHRKNIFKKLQIHSVTQLIDFAIANDLKAD